MAAEARIQRADDEAFDDMVEATRLGTVFASNLSAYRRWRRRRDATDRRRRPALSPAALETAVANIGRLFPDNVIHEVMH